MLQSLLNFATPLGIISLFSIYSSTAVSQQVDLFNSENVPVRITFNPNTPLLGGGKSIPYEKMATFISNAFVEPDALQNYVQDSTVCFDGEEFTTEFSPSLIANYIYQNENIAEIQFIKVRENGDRQLFSRKQFEYDQEVLTKYIYSNWDISSDQWVFQNRVVLEPESNNRMMQFIEEVWDGNIWTPSERQTLIYNEDEFLEKVEWHKYEEGVWVEYQKILAEYNDNSLPVKIEIEDFVDGQWRTILTEIYEYDSFLNFYLEAYTQNIWDEGTNSMDPSIRELYEYNLRGFYENRIQQIWNTVNEEWVNVSKDKFNYSPRGIWTSWDRMVWKNSDWQNQLRRTFKFEDGHQLDIEQIWSSDDSLWVRNKRRMLKFDEFGNLITEQNFQSWDPIQNQWTNTGNTKRCFHYWSPESSTGYSNTQSPLAHCIFMNPYLIGSEIQCISMTEGKQYQVNLIDQLGRHVYKRLLKGKESFYINSDIPEGLYYLSIFQDSKHEVIDKIIIKK